MSAENPLSLGEFLRQEREKRGYTIEQVASASKIGVKTLLHLEADHYVDLPAVPFIRGFVTSYARFIGLDPKEVLTKYASFIEQKSKERPDREGGHSGYAFEKREGEQTSRTILGVTMGVFVVIAGVGFVFFKPSRHHRSSQVEKLRMVHGAPSPSASPEALLVAAIASPSPSATASASPVPAPVVTTAAATSAPVVTPTHEPVQVAAAPSPTPSATETAPDPLNSGVNLKKDQIKHKMVLKAQESVWVRYQADERPVMQFVLKKDKALVLRAERMIKVQVGNPSVITFSYNQSPIKTVEKSKNITTRQGDPTLMFPTEGIDKIQEPFPNTKPLSTRPAPVSSGASSSPTPTP